MGSADLALVPSPPGPAAMEPAVPAAETHDEGADPHHDEAGAQAEAGEGAPEFWPFPAADHDYEIRNGSVYLKGELVCDFVPRAIGEEVRHLDLDDETRVRRNLIVRFELPDGQVFERRLESPERELDRGKAILRAVPSDLARLSVVSTKQVARAAGAFKSPSFFIERVVEQTGWLPGSSHFALPATPGVDLSRIGSLPGMRLLRFPTVPDLAAARAAVSEVITIMTSAPPEVVAPVIATIAAAPLFREKLAARGFITKLSGATGAGKTTLVRTACAMLGDFHQQPGCMTTWRSTTTTLEQAVHTLRDLPVFIDDYRTNDSGATESLRNIAMMVGNGVGRVRSHRRDGELGVESALRGNSLVLATGEHIAEHDGGVAARLLELDAQDIDFRRLIAIRVDSLRRLPHLYGSYIAWLARLPPDTWLEAKEHHARVCDELGRSSRATENVATLLIGLQLLMKFLEHGVNASAVAIQQYRDVVAVFQNGLPQLVRLQELRIGESTVEQMALSELARGVRSGQVILRSVPDSGSSGPKGGLILGFDSLNLYLPPSETERWVSSELRRAGVIAKPIGRGNLGAALTERDQRRQVVLAGRRPHCWVLARARLGDEWRELVA